MNILSGISKSVVGPKLRVFTKLVTSFLVASNMMIQRNSLVVSFRGKCNQNVSVLKFENFVRKFWSLVKVPLRIPTVKLKISRKAFFKSESRISVTFKL